jgi:hypothetical protein
MALLAQLRNQRSFWFVVAGAVVLLILYILSSGYFNNPYRYLVTWEKLPALPNGEKALALTDVLVRNRINVVTVTGNYYSCPYRSMKNCWIPIPREVNTPVCKVGEIRLPELPDDAQNAACSHITYNHGDVDILMAIIRKDGQVYMYEGKDSNLYDRFFHKVSDLCCGVLSLALLMAFLSVVLKARDALRST